MLGGYIDFHMYQLDEGINWVSGYRSKDSKLNKGIKDLQIYPFEQRFGYIMKFTLFVVEGTKLGMNISPLTQNIVINLRY